jgi:hypothetical protein
MWALFVASMTLSVILHHSFTLLTLRFTIDLVLEDAIEYDQQPNGSYVTSNVGSLLLNGNNVCIFVPGGCGPL